MAGFYFADKPAGVTTHSSSSAEERRHRLRDRHDGLVEALSDRLNHPLHVVHRLDKETTGAICFAKTPESAEILRELFTAREVSKKYLFLTDRSVAGLDDGFEVESFIERRKNEYVSEPPTSSQPANSKTWFKKLAASHGIELWQAVPESGKPHQIRLHAASQGLPILGDEDHGGSPFPALCLHSHELSFMHAGAAFATTSPPPVWFEDRGLISDSTLIRWLAACDRRERLSRSQLLEDGIESTTCRWIHTEGDPLRVEQLGPVVQLSWFGDQEPSSPAWNSIQRLRSEKNWKNWYLQIRGNRGRAPNEEKIWKSDELPTRWVAKENGLTYEFRSDTGLSAGLFLDQRRNRHWVRENSRSKTVLNLFCYTAGFSVAAASGGAAKTVSVDVSKNFLEWGKRNFEVNGLSLDPHEFRAMDSREYLSWAKKKGLRFDLIVCDPPSFSRSKSGLFKIEKDFPSLLSSLLDVLAPGGRVLFSSNYEQWSVADFAIRAKGEISSRKARYRLESTPSPDWDFELPLEPSNMKSFFIVLD